MGRRSGTVGSYADFGGSEMMYWTAPRELMPFDEYWVDYGSARVPTNNLVSAVRLASDRARRLRSGVEITGADGALVGVAQCDHDGVPIMYWTYPRLGHALSGMVFLGLAACVAICVAALMRLA